MTTEGSVWNHRTQQFKKILFFFDTGREPTPENTLQKISHFPKNQAICAMSGIGGHVEKFRSSVVTLKICTAYGMEIIIRAQTKPVITSGFSSVNIKRCTYWLDDYHYRFVPPYSQIIKLPSGLHIAKTASFGLSIHARGILSIGSRTNTSKTNDHRGLSEDLQPDSVCNNLPLSMNQQRQRCSTNYLNDKKIRIHVVDLSNNSFLCGNIYRPTKNSRNGTHKSSKSTDLPT
ncbi:hypothetical protein COOONC_05013 [Cooperia oncophora]